MLKCSKCNELKDECEFDKRSSTKRGYKSWCKICRKEFEYEKNKDKILIKRNLYYVENKEDVNKKSKLYRDNNKEAIKIQKKMARVRDKEKIKEQKRQSYLRNIDSIRLKAKQKRILKNNDKVCLTKEEQKIISKNKKREYGKIYSKNRKKLNVSFKLATNLRTRVSQLIKKNKCGSAVSDLGCSVDELKIYLENLFYFDNKTGEIMTWDNYGYYGWHIDHIIPLSSFDLTNREQFLKACHYTNLQPLWWQDNLSKGNKMPGNY